MQRLVWYMAVAQWDRRQRADALRPMTGVRIVHLMPTFKACKDIHKDLTLADLEGGGEWAWLGAKIDRTSWHIKFPGGSWIQWFGAREANSARGIRCDIVTVDECDDIDPSVLDSVVKPWFTEAWSLRTRLTAGTPRRGRYGLLYREHKSGLDGNMARVQSLDGLTARERKNILGRQRNWSFHATYRDAPETVDPEYAEEQRLEYERTGSLAVFKREWECDFDSAEGLVYPMFDKGFHVREPPQGTVFAEYLVGADFGWEDPGVYLECGVVGHGQDATLYITNEVYQTHRDNTWWDGEAREIVRRRPDAKWYCDTSRPDRLADLRRLGARVQHLDKPRVESSVATVADRLAIRHMGDDFDTRYSRLYISPRCKNTIEEFGKYRRRRDPKNADRFLDDIEDKNNHCLVAGTMVETIDGPVPIENVTVGTLVATRSGYRPVTWSGMTFERVPTWELLTSVGTVEGTADHPVFADGEWVRLDSVRGGAVLESIQHGVRGTATAMSKRPTGRSTSVYDLTVDGAHEFFANGVLVHNSMDACRYLTFGRFGMPPRTVHEQGAGWV